MFIFSWLCFCLEDFLGMVLKRLISDAVSGEKYYSQLSLACFSRCMYVVKDSCFEDPTQSLTSTREECFCGGKKTSFTIVSQPTSEGN